jgi:hypothetical protein
MTIVERPYAEETPADVGMFLGTEVEHSPAMGLPTLFVVGLQDPDQVIEAAEKYQVEHIYLGANHSFDPENQSIEWADLIRACLTRFPLMVTLDFDLQHCNWVLEEGFGENSRFVPMISVKLPYVGLFNYNTTVKIDDTGFDKTNPGVWCHRLIELLNPAKFTNWTQYKKDSPL